MLKFSAPSVVAGTVTLALTLSACGGDDPATRAFEPEHVHGLAQDSGGRVLVATHDGLFAVNEEQVPVPVNGLTTDLMGFTVDSDGTFFASGHPGEGEDGPANLGLVSSTDNGATFSEISLGGQVDFHSLAATGNAIYGVEGGTTLMRSDDSGLTWEEINLSQPVADIAVDPDAETILATSEDGLLQSQDLGRSFDLLPEAPVLLLVDWSIDGALVGVDPDGQVFGAADSGTWTPKAQLDPPQALTVTDEGAIYVATEKALLRSEDMGSSFTTVTEW